MGAELLAWMLHHRQPTDDEVKDAQEFIQDLREPDKRLSFVKIRAADDLVFLQDEMYALMEKIHKDSAATILRNRINSDILGFYEWKIRQTRSKIEEMEKNLQVVGEITADKLTQIGKRSTAPEEEQTRRARAALAGISGRAGLLHSAGGCTQRV